MTLQSLLSLACSHQANGRWNHAISAYKDVLIRNPNQLQAILGIAEIAKHLGQIDTAFQLFSQIINLDPKYARAFGGRGQLLQMIGKPLNAITDLSTAIGLGWKSAELFNSRGIAFAHAGKLEQAIADFNAAIKIQSNFADAFFNRALAHRKNENYIAAIEDYTEALHLTPDHFQAYNNRGFAYRELGQIDKAIADFLKSSKVNPKFHDGYWNASLGLLMLGDYKRGWRLYEHRWQSAGFTSPRRDFLAPVWLGKERLAGKTILLHSEQGLGDSIQFCRYVPMVMSLGCKVILEVEKPLISLLKSLSARIQIIEKNAAKPSFDYHCPLMSLPLAFSTKLETIPSTGPYLEVDDTRVKWWKVKLGASKKTRIGLVWRGNPKHPNDRNRSIILRDIIAELSHDIDWISLQKNLSSDEKTLINASKKITHLGDLTTDFADSGALCSALDAILCVDTSIAHLGGALGLPIYMLIPHIPDFRWQNSGSSTPWYDSFKIFRQGADRNWVKPLKIAQNSLLQDHHSQLY